MRPSTAIASAALVVMTWGAAADAPAYDLSNRSRAIGEARQLREDSPFAPGLPLTRFGRDSARFEHELRGKIKPVSFLLTGSASAREGEASTGKLVANEVYADLPHGKDRFALGKKILSGDVGYAFRPIDVIQREQRLQLLPPALEGIPSLLWERFQVESAWSVVWANPGRGIAASPRDDESLALRGYSRWLGADLHGVTRFSSRYRTEAGAAFSAVPSEQMEVHASFLVQRRGERTAPLAEPAAPADLLNPDLAVATTPVRSARKGLLGLTWTFANGWSLLAETWWDGTAPSSTDWSTLAAQTERRTALQGAPGVPAEAVSGAIAASTRMFQAPSLARRASLGRVSWTDPGGSGWSGSLDWLRSLDDGGWTATAALGWEADRLRLDAGMRVFGGKRDSAYGLFPERRVAYVGARVAF